MSKFDETYKAIMEDKPMPVPEGGYKDFMERLAAIKIDKALIAKGLKTTGDFITDPEALAELEKIGAVRKSVEGKWYWLFPDEDSKKKGMSILRKIRSTSPKLAFQDKNFLQMSAMPDSKGRYTKVK